MWVVNPLVAVHDRHLLCVEVATTEVVIVVAGRILSPCVDKAVVLHYACNLVKPFLICSELALFVVVKAIETNVL